MRILRRWSPLNHNNTSQKDIRKESPLSWWIWILSILFLFYEFFLRVFPAVMVKDLMQAFQMTAGSFGVLSAFYFYAYALIANSSGIAYGSFLARVNCFLLLLLFAALEVFYSALLITRLLRD